MILAIIAFVVGAACGSAFFYGSAITFRRRWHQATRTLQGFNQDELDKLLSPQRPVGDATRRLQEMAKESLNRSTTAMTPNKLLRLSNGARVEIETARLEQGLPPMDPLTNLSNGATTAIMHERIKRGWG